MPEKRTMSGDGAVTCNESNFETTISNNACKGSVRNVFLLHLRSTSATAPYERANGNGENSVERNIKGKTY